MKVQRIGTYKTGFKYYLKNVEITDPDRIQKIKDLKIPPAYSNVTIVNGKKIIAYGYDSKNRKQVIYNPNYIKKQNNIKFNKINSLTKHYSKLKSKLNKDVSSLENSKNKLIAIIILLIINCGFRIGNKKYEKENNSYGITTLKKKHFKIENDKLIIDFIGKKNVRNVSICKNEIIKKFFLSLIDKLNDEDYIFKYYDVCINACDVNKYLELFSKKYNMKITTKDLRTLNANTLFLKYFKKYKNIKKAILYTANNLHNTYSVCKKSYIDPNLILHAEKELNK
jgi:DNA topoisomerase I